MNILITGATSGIGLQIALKLAGDPSNKIIVIARSQEKINSLHEILQSRQLKNIEIIHLDITSFEPATLPGMLTRYISIDILINNAGMLINKKFIDLSMEDWQQMFNVNLLGTVKVIHSVFPLLQKSKHAHIVNIGSMGGYQGASKFPGLSAYSASKAALANLTECLAEEFSEYKISVNCLALGAVDTEMMQNAFPEYKAPVSPEEMAEFIADFSLTAHKFINGKVLPVSISTP